MGILSNDIGIDRILMLSYFLNSIMRACEYYSHNKVGRRNKIKNMWYGLVLLLRLTRANKPACVPQADRVLSFLTPSL